MHSINILFILLFCLGLCACETMNDPNKSAQVKTAPTRNLQTKQTKNLLSTTSKSSAQEREGEDEDIDNAIDFDSNVNDNFSTSVSDGNLWDDIRENMQLPDETDHPEVQRQIVWFQSNQKYFQRVITRASPFIYYIYQQTKARNMPSELALLPIIESAYNPLAYSRAGAMGLWQMMPGTASLLGLKVNWWYDGRRDLTASTRAALNYLAYLYENLNHDWLLAIAGYNCGDNRVQAGINFNRRHDLSVDFWTLSPRLPQQTQNYVPKLLAVAAIIKDPERYNITLPPINNAPYIESIKMNSQIDLHQAAELANVDMKTIHALNPGYLRWATDPDGPYEIIIPSDKADIFKQNLESLSESEKIIWRDYHAQPGDSLDEIADKYNTESEILKRVNNLSSSYIKPQQHLLIPANYHGSPKSSVVEEGAQLSKENMPPAPSVKPVKATPAKKHLYIYKVTKNDTLYSLAKRFGSDPELIKQTNHINNNLHPGQIIKIPGYSSQTPISSGTKKKIASHKTTHYKKTKHKSINKGR